MEQFSVKLSGLSQRVEEEKKIVNELKSIESSIRTVRRYLDSDVCSQSNLRNVLNQLANNVNEIQRDMETMRFVLANVRNQYEKTENRICGKANDYTITEDDVWEAMTTIGAGLAINAMFPGAGCLYWIHELLKDEEFAYKWEAGKFKHTIWEKKRKEYEYKDGKWTEKVPKEKKDKTDEQKRKDILENITVWSDSRSASNSLLHFGKDGDVETDWGSYTYSADVLKADAHASGFAGLGGVGGEVGVALTALTTIAGGQLGDDMLGVHGKVGIDVGKVEAKAGAKISIWGEDGKLDLSAKISGSAEAIAAEANAEVGVDLVGADINGTVGVNFGIGAHADIGFDDWKVKFDVGASVGLGVSVDLEIDLSGTVEMACDFASDVGDFAGDVYNTVTDFASDVGDNVSDFVSDVGGGIADGLSKGWATVTSWF